MEPGIIFQDDYLLILDKPSGWIVNEAKTTKSAPVIQTWLKTNFDYEIAKDAKFRSGFVHRIDKETSGILVVAKTRKAFRNLQEQFKQRKVTKTYTALAHGKIELGEGTINVPVGRLPWNRERFGVLPGGRKAETYYRVISNFQFPISNENLTLLELRPKTGRTHQIRIHLKYLGHPIVSDDFYAGRKTAQLDRKWCPRLFLHASGIVFSHPETKKDVSFKSNLPDDLKSSLRKLSKI
jgi:23S rRNA pseudouridine1911/1915/1917 synthase